MLVLSNPTSSRRHGPALSNCGPSVQVDLFRAASLRHLPPCAPLGDHNLFGPATHSRARLSGTAYLFLVNWLRGELTAIDYRAPLGWTSCGAGRGVLRVATRAVITALTALLWRIELPNEGRRSGNVCMYTCVSECIGKPGKANLEQAETTECSERWLPSECTH